VATVDVEVNPSSPATPTVTLSIKNADGYLQLDIDAADGSESSKTVSFDIFRDGTRIATGLTPDQSTRQASFRDFPATSTSPAYTVRAWNAERGFADQTTGTVAEVN
jgi:hypothetical protein